MNLPKPKTKEGQQKRERYKDVLSKREGILKTLSLKHIDDHK